MAFIIILSLQSVQPSGASPDFLIIVVPELLWDLVFQTRLAGLVYPIHSKAALAFYALTSAPMV